VSGKRWNGRCNNITRRGIEDDEKPRRDLLHISIAHDLSLYGGSGNALVLLDFTCQCQARARGRAWRCSPPRLSAWRKSVTAA
jgi:hypothetical protein